MSELRRAERTCSVRLTWFHAREGNRAILTFVMAAAGLFLIIANPGGAEDRLDPWTEWRGSIVPVLSVRYERK